MPLQHAQLKANALMELDKFVTAFTRNKKHQILTNQRVDMSEMLRMDP